MATTQQQALTTLGTEPITAEQLLEMDAKGMRGELIRGVFCPTMSAGIRHGQIVMELGRLLGNAIADTRAGSLIGSDDYCSEPDIAYFSKEQCRSSRRSRAGTHRSGLSQQVAAVDQRRRPTRRNKEIRPEP